MLIILLFLFFFLKTPVLADSAIKITDFSSDSDTEWVQLTNNTSENLTLDGWYFKDNADHIRNIDKACLSPSTNKTFSYSSGWLNNDGDTINLYNSSGNLIDQLIYSDSESKNQSLPLSTSTCLIPTNTPTPTLTPSPTPTTDPTVVNPDSGVSLTEFMPYSDPEWVELYNNNDYPVKLVSWKLEDKDANIRNISSLIINSKSYAIFEYSPFFDNNNSENVILRNQNNVAISQMSYPNGLRTLERSWSLINNNWCQSSITKGYSNVVSCYTVPTLTPTSTIIPSPTITPINIEETPSIEPTPIITNIPTLDGNSENSNNSSNSGLILGDSNTSSTKQNFLPIILIFGGAILLLSPLIISKLRKS